MKKVTKKALVKLANEQVFATTPHTIKWKPFKKALTNDQLCQLIDLLETDHENQFGRWADGFWTGFRLGEQFIKSRLK